MQTIAEYRNQSLASWLSGGEQTAAPIGQRSAGNINLHNRPMVKNADGSISTVRTITMTDSDGSVVNIPTVSDDGRIMSDDEAWGQYKKTGRHLGKFDTIDNAVRAAKSLHNEQDQEYLGSKSKTGMYMPKADTYVPQADVSSTVQPIQQPQQQRRSQMNPQGNSNMLRQLLNTSGGAAGGSGALTTTQATTAGGGLASSSGGIGVASVPGGVGNAAVAGGTTATGAGGAAGAGGTAGGATAGGSAAGGGFGGAMAGAGPYAALAALVVGGKAAQRSQGSNSAGRALHGTILPSMSQYLTDIKKGNWKGVGASVIGLPFLNAWLSSDEAVEKDPEWQPLINSFTGGGR